MAAVASTPRAASGSAPQDSIRAARLQEVAVRAIDESLAGSVDEFVNAFPSIKSSHHAELQQLYFCTKGALRENTMAEFDQIFGESGVPASLERLDLLVARQPELPDGSRLPLTSESEASDLIAAATLPSKRQQKAALLQALRDVEQENASLQAQYLEVQPTLTAASAEIASCKALVEKTATTCERWRAANA